MKKMQIFEPAMCCSTGICGVGVDPELLRISTILNTLEKNNVKIERFNLSNAPQEFITNSVVNTYIKDKGAEGLPITVVENEIVITGRYPQNEEIAKLMDIPMSILGESSKKEENSCGCDCSDGCC